MSIFEFFGGNLSGLAERGSQLAARGSQLEARTGSYKKIREKEFLHLQD